MARKPSPVLSASDSSNWRFVVTWLARRFDQEEFEPVEGFVMSEPVAVAIDQGDVLAIDRAQAAVRESWRALQREWVHGWERDYNGKIENADAVFTDLVERTNDWIERHFPVDETGVGKERARLLGAVRQQRLREFRKSDSRRKGLQVSITGDLYTALRRQYDIPESKHHDVVRASLRLVLDSPEFLVKVKDFLGVTV